MNFNINGQTISWAGSPILADYEQELHTHTHMHTPKHHTHTYTTHHTCLHTHTYTPHTCIHAPHIHTIHTYTRNTHLQSLSQNLRKLIGKIVSLLFPWKKRRKNTQKGGTGKGGLHKIKNVEICDPNPKTTQIHGKHWQQREIT